MGQKHSEVTKRKISLAKKGQTPWIKGRHHTMDARQKMSLSSKGRTHSETTREKLGQISKMYWSDPGFREFVHWARMGHKVSPETRKKMSEAAKKRLLNGTHNFHYNGGKTTDGGGRILLRRPDHPFCNTRKYVRESRLIMEGIIGRFLQPAEVVHHINGDKTDNRPKNLMLFANNSDHLRFHKSHLVSLPKNPF